MLRRGHISHTLKMHYFFLKSSSLFPEKYIVMMTNVGFTKIINFMTPGAVVLVLGRGHISHIGKMHYFFKKILFTLRHLYQNCKMP